jgi:hypothetical protein
MEARLGKTLNIEVVGDFTSFLKRVKTQNFDIGRWNHEVLRLEGFSGYDFKSESIFLSFFWFSRFAS